MAVATVTLLLLLVVVVMWRRFQSCCFADPVRQSNGIHTRLLAHRQEHGH